MTPPPATSNESPNFESIGRLYYDNEQLRLRVKELESENSKGSNYKERYREKCEKYDDLERSYDLLKEENRRLKQQLNDGIPHSSFPYNFDVMDFNDNMECKDIERLMDICLELTETKLPRGFLMEDSMDVVPIYILLAEKKRFQETW